MCFPVVGDVVAELSSHEQEFLVTFEYFACEPGVVLGEARGRQQQEEVVTVNLHNANIDL